MSASDQGSWVPAGEAARAAPEGERPSGNSVGTRVESILDAAERAALGIREDAQEWARRYLEDSRRKADEAASARIKEISSLTDNLVSRARAVAQQSDELLSALDEAGRRVIDSARPGSNDVAAAPPPPPAPERQPAPAIAPEAAAAPPPPAPPPPAPPQPATQQPAPYDAAPPSAPQRPADPPPSPQSAPPQPAAPPAAVPPPPAAPPPVAGPPSLPHRPPEPPAVPPPAPPAPGPPAAVPGDGGRVSEGARLLATQMAVAGSTRDEIAWRLREEFGIEDSAPILDEIGI